MRIIPHFSDRSGGPQLDTVLDTADLPRRYQCLGLTDIVVKNGIRVLEFAGLAPGPFCGRILSDWGASVVRVDKQNALSWDYLSAGKRSIIVDSKHAEGKKVLLKLANASDVLIDPFRPGVLERLGLGPENVHPTNPGLIFARITGYGQTGPYSQMAGHDINYVALSGVLSTLGRKDTKPFPPINLLADFAGGGLMAAFGVTLALLHRQKTGQGQVVDCSMAEGAAYTSSFIYNMQEVFPIFGKPRGENPLDGGAHFYDTYETADGRHMAVGAIEPQFYHQFIDKLGLDPEQVGQYDDPAAMKEIVADQFRTKTMKQWSEIFAGSDACVSPVLTLREAPQDVHNVARGAFEADAPPYATTQDGGVKHTPAPAPRLSASPADGRREGICYPVAGQHSRQVLQELGYSAPQQEELLSSGAVAEADEVAPTSKL